MNKVLVNSNSNPGRIRSRSSERQSREPERRKKTDREKFKQRELEEKQIVCHNTPAHESETVSFSVYEDI